MLNSIRQNQDEPIMSQEQVNQMVAKLSKQTNKVESLEGSRVVRMTLKKKQTLREKKLRNNSFSQEKNEKALKVIPTFKVKPIQLINKIQQSRPNYQNSIVCKELAYDVLIQEQNDKTLKLTNCVSNSRPNSQIYKRFSKSFFENIKNGIDQCMLFTSTEAGARVQSSIGNQNNPGIFMIVAIAVLDEKYKQSHESFDAEFSFLEYRGQKMYDLINYTEEPLIPKAKESSNNNQKVQNIEFGQHFVKVCTFLQFIKLFKIALFNNKERDIKTNRSMQDTNSSQKQLQYTSSFIMKIKVKKYDTDNRLIFEQQTTLIDLDQNCSSRNNGQKSDKFSYGQNQKLQLKNAKRTSSQISNRTIIDFILIEINNSNPLNKPIHYHMVEKNILLEMVKKYLRAKQPLLLSKSTMNSQQQHQSVSSNKINHAREQPKQYPVGGFLFIINSFTTSPFMYTQNIKFYQTLTLTVGEQWQGIAKQKNVQKRDINLVYSQSILNQIIVSLKGQSYSSFKSIYAAKQFYISQSKGVIADVKQYRSFILDYSNQKKQLSYNQNLLTAFQLQLIGKCIKSDNFKDFYVSKTYLSLPRQIQIKTEKVKTLIKDQLNSLKVIQEKFHSFKKKQIQNKKSQQIPDFTKVSSFPQDKQQSRSPRNEQKFDKTMQKTTKFKLLNRQQSISSQSFNHFEKFNELKKYIYDYLNEIWSRILIDQQRTVAERFIFEDNLAKDLRNLKQSFKIFIKQIGNIDESKIKYSGDEPNNEIQNLNKLIRSVQMGKKSAIAIKEQQPKRLKKQLNASQKCFKIKKEIIASERMMILPKIYSTGKLTHIKQKFISSNITTEDIQKEQRELIQIKGKVNFGTLLLNPKRIA